MCNKTILVVDNPNVEIVDINTFKCVHCGEVFCPDDISNNCPECDVPLFEKMSKTAFKDIFINCLKNIGISDAKINTLITTPSMPIFKLGICTELSVIIDINFQLKYGAKYNTFYITDSLKTFVTNNFK